jgi:iron-sulfur cluster repair protein YtfE (RIC family)
MPDSPATWADETLNAIVDRCPRALTVFHHHGLDACCGGALPLREVAWRHRLDLAVLLDALDGAVAGAGAD